MAIKPPSPCCGSKSPAHYQIINLMREHEGQCYYCQVLCTMTCGIRNGRLADNTATRDHLIPRSDGGHAAHLVLACFKCNNKLGNIPYQERRKFINV